MLFPETSPFETKSRQSIARPSGIPIPDEAHVYAATARTPVENEVLANWYERLNNRIHQDGSDGELEDLRDDIYSYLKG